MTDSCSFVVIVGKSNDNRPISSCICTVYWNGKAKVMMVDSVETMKKYRGKGYATQLMEKVMKMAESMEVDSIELVTSGGVEAANRLYDKFGLAPTGKQHWRRILNKWPT